MIKISQLRNRLSRDSFTSLEREEMPRIETKLSTFNRGKMMVACKMLTLREDYYPEKTDE